MKKAIVTVLLGNYDKPKKAPNFKGWDAFMFTDLDIDPSLGWSVIKIVGTTSGKLTKRCQITIWYAILMRLCTYTQSHQVRRCGLVTLHAQT